MRSRKIAMAAAVSVVAVLLLILMLLGNRFDRKPGFPSEDRHSRGEKQNSSPRSGPGSIVAAPPLPDVSEERFRVVVKDIDGVPVSGAQVEVRGGRGASEERSERAVTSTSGVAEVNVLQVGALQIRTTALGFHPDTRDVASTFHGAVTVELRRMPDVVFEVREWAPSMGRLEISLSSRRPTAKDTVSPVNSNWYGDDRRVEVVLPRGTEWRVAIVSSARDGERHELGVYFNSEPALSAPIIPTQRVEICRPGSQFTVRLDSGSWGPVGELEVSLVFPNPVGEGTLGTEPQSPAADGTIEFGDLPVDLNGWYVWIQSPEGQLVHRMSLSDIEGERDVDVRVPEPGRVRYRVEASEEVLSRIRGSEVGLGFDRMIKRRAGAALRDESGAIKLVRAVSNWNDLPRSHRSEPVRVVILESSAVGIIDEMAPGARKVMLFSPVLGVKSVGRVDVVSGEVSEVSIRIRGFEEGGSEFVAVGENGEQLLRARWFLKDAEIATDRGVARIAVEPGDYLICRNVGFVSRRVNVGWDPPIRIEVTLRLMKETER